MSCPRCPGSMHPDRVRGAEALRCRACDLCWFDPHQLARALDVEGSPAERAALVAEAGSTTGAAVPGRCPACRREQLRTIILLGESGLRCTSCGGVAIPGARVREHVREGRRRYAADVVTVGGAIVAAVLLTLVPPWAGLLGFVLLALRFLAEAWVLWRRAGLRFSACARLVGFVYVAFVATSSLATAPLSSAWQTSDTELMIAALLLGAMVIASVELPRIDRRRHPERWHRVQERTRSAGLWDLLLARHLTAS